MSRLKGEKELLKILKQIPDDLKGNVKDLVEGEARNIARDAKKAAPVDTGFLEQTIAVSQPIRDQGRNETYTITANAPYAAYVEYGTPVGTGPNGGPKPFFFPAVFAGQKRFIRGLKDLLNSTFKKV